MCYGMACGSVRKLLVVFLGLICWDCRYGRVEVFGGVHKVGLLDIEGQGFQDILFVIFLLVFVAFLSFVVLDISFEFLSSN